MTPSSIKFIPVHIYKVCTTTRNASNLPVCWCCCHFSIFFHFFSSVSGYTCQHNCVCCVKVFSLLNKQWFNHISSQSDIPRARWRRVWKYKIHLCRLTVLTYIQQWENFSVYSRGRFAPPLHTHTHRKPAKLRTKLWNLLLPWWQVAGKITGVI